MYEPNQGNTQVYSLFGTYVVEQHGEGFVKGRRFDVSDPTPSKAQPAPAADGTAKAA